MRLLKDIFKTFFYLFKKPNSEQTKAIDLLPQELVSKKRNKKEIEVLDYLLKNGSIDKVTCKQVIGVKRLDNIICDLRKQGWEITNEKVCFINQYGEKKKAYSYKLIK
jgi:hypothetical protein